MKFSNDRRTFLKNGALAGLGLPILKTSRLAYSYQANEKLNVALIGVGGRGSWFVGTIPKLGANIIAMCDVNERKAGSSFEEIPVAKNFFDFRKMLQEMDKQIDAVVIATPDHTRCSFCNGDENGQTRLLRKAANTDWPEFLEMLGAGYRGTSLA